MHTHSAIEQELFSQGREYIAGLDEAGRGPLAGPVVAAAVIFPREIEIEGIADSKKLSAKKRSELAAEIRTAALSWAIGSADNAEIDDINILQASILAMHRAVAGLRIEPGFLLVDGNRFHHETLPFKTIVQGDSRCFSIAAASILAKVHRDTLMIEYDTQYPDYGFAKHKGYPTRFHIDAVRMRGNSPIHRKSFTVKQLVEQQGMFDKNGKQTAARQKR